MLADWLSLPFGILLFVANVTAWCGTFYRLPGNWIIVANSTLYLAFFGAKANGGGFGWFLISLLVVLAALGDSLTFATRKFHWLPPRDEFPGLKRVLLGAGSGSFLGAVLGLAVPVVGPLLSIVGAVGGAAGGAWLGTLLASRVPALPQTWTAGGAPPFLGLSEQTARLIPRLLVGAIMTLITGYRGIFG